MIVWDFRCDARCDNRFATSTCLNQTIWDMEEAGWLIELAGSDGVRATKVRCPEHTNVVPGEVWMVECRECYLEEEYEDPDEAEEAAADHNEGDWDDWDCRHPEARVLNPEEVAKREERKRRLSEESKQRRQERDVHERYVAFLISQDQQRKRAMEEARTTPHTRPDNRRRWVLAVFAVLAVLLALAILSSCGASGKYSERYKDAPRSDSNNGEAADTITFPDGFSNVATKCDHGNRVYVLFHEDSAYGGLAVVPNAKGC